MTTPSTTPVLFDRYFEEYVMGERGPAGCTIIEDEDIAAFAELTGDRHPAHTDPVFAAPRFGGVIAHGALSFGVVVGLTVEYNRLAVAYGYDRLRFPTAVKAGDRVTATSEVVELKDHKNPRIGLVTKQYTGVNDAGAAVLVCRHILAVDRRP